MASSRMLLVLLACSFQGSIAYRARITPVQQVLKMMTDMKVKAEKSMEAEQKTYATYAEWVDDRTQELGFEIETGKSTIEKLVAFMDEASNKVKVLTNEIKELDGEISRMESEKEEATKIRKAQKAEYDVVSVDYSESVDALTRAIQVMEQQNFDRDQAVELMQKMVASHRGMNRVLAAFLQQNKAAEPGAPAVAAYEFQSGGIMQVMEDLLKKFKGELSDVEEAETNQAHSYNLMVQHLTDTITKATSDREEKSEIKSKTLAAIAKAKGDLADTKKEKAADEATLSEMKATFGAKSEVYEENQKVRKGELEALTKAIEIISSPNVASSYSEHVNLAQLSKPTSPAFLQLRSARHRLLARDRAAALLAKKADSLDSKQLQLLSQELSASPFGKVITLIKDLLAKLKAEASAEAEHKAWCDKELKANKHKRDKKASTVDELSAEMQGLGAEIASLGDKIKTLVQEQADLAKAMNEATTQRDKEKATNLDTIADAKAGSTAVKKALTVLQEFYSAQSFAQTGKQVPEMEAYSGQQGKNKGVVGMLEVIHADFMRLETETKAAENQAAREYESFMKTAKADSLEKHNHEEKLRLEKDQAEFEQGQTKKDLDSNVEALAEANKYYDYLKPQCLEVPVNYEERAQKRQEEIAALKEAWEVLNQKGSA